MSAPASGPAVLCGACRRLVSRSARVCPHCGARMPALLGANGPLQRAFRDLDMTALLINISISAYLVSLMATFATEPQALFEPRDWFSIGAPGRKATFLLGETSGPSLFAGRAWTLLNASYLHYGILHIGFNLMWLRQLGQLAQGLLGPARLFVLFTVSGLGGFLLSDLVSGAPTAGASCGLFGLMGALVVFGRRRGGVQGRALFEGALRWAVMGTLYSFMLGGVNHLGHGGGFVAGALAALAMPKHEGQHESRGVQLLALALAGLTALSMGTGLISALLGARG